MAIEAPKSGFYGTDHSTFYVTPAGRIYASSVDFDGIREVRGLDEGATPIDGLMTPDEAIEFIKAVEAESGESILEVE